MCRNIYRVHRWKTETESTNCNWGRVYLYHVLIGDAAFSVGFHFTDQ